jgi:hypothetical protein
VQQDRVAHGPESEIQAHRGRELLDLTGEDARLTVASAEFSQFVPRMLELTLKLVDDLRVGGGHVMLHAVRVEPGGTSDVFELGAAQARQS